jgi:hypothetical protein
MGLAATGVTKEPTMIKSDTLPRPPKDTPATGTAGPAEHSVPDATRAVGDTAQASGGDGTPQSSDWLAEARVGSGPASPSGGDEAKGPPMRSGSGGADRAGHTEESHRGQY